MPLKPVTSDPAVQLYAAPAYEVSGVPFRVSNLDLVNTIYLDDNIGVNAASSPLPPLATVTYDGQRDVWASTLNDSVSVMSDVDPHSLSWDSPLQIAQALSNMGTQPELGVGGNFVAFKRSVTATSTILAPISSPLRLWGIWMSASVSSTSGGSLSASILLNAGQYLAELDFQPPSSGPPQYGSLYVPFPGGYSIGSGGTINLELVSGAGITWLASAFLALSNP